MRFFFADDGKQTRPTRDRMGSLVAIGGVVVSADHVRHLELEIGRICEESRFPPREEFKWSPRREQWMWAKLVDEQRKDFFLRILGLAATYRAGVLVVIEDIGHARAMTDAPSAEADVTGMFLERADTYLRKADVNDDGVVIVDRPGGGRGEEDKFLLQCLEMLQVGTKYVKPERIALPVLSTPSDLVRLAQLADVVTGCTLSYVAGETLYAPAVFDAIRPLLLRDGLKIGGIGLKIHPDFVYGNLYHWLLGDTHLWKMAMGLTLPISYRPYGRSPNIY